MAVKVHLTEEQKHKLRTRAHTFSMEDLKRLYAPKVGIITIRTFLQSEDLAYNNAPDKYTLPEVASITGLHEKTLRTHLVRLAEEEIGLTVRGTISSNKIYKRTRNGRKFSRFMVTEYGLSKLIECSKKERSESIKRAGWVTNEYVAKVFGVTTGAVNRWFFGKKKTRKTSRGHFALTYIKWEMLWLPAPGTVRLFEPHSVEKAASEWRKNVRNS